MVQRLLSAGEEVQDQSLLFRSHSALLVHLETLEEDLHHAEKCMCQIYGACFTLPRFPRKNVRDRQTRSNTSVYWTRSLVKMFLAQGGAIDLKLGGYSSNPDIQRPLS